MTSTIRLGMLVLVLRSGLGSASMFPSRLRFFMNTICCAYSTTKNGDPRAANGADNGVGKVLPFPTDGTKMFLSCILW